MIITSLLDTDLYKFTMMQVVLHHFPAAMVEYRFKCRSVDVDLRQFADEIQTEINAFCALQFTQDELNYLGGFSFFSSDFIEFLRIFKLNKNFICITCDDEFNLKIKGPWLHTILFEIPILAIISEVYFRHVKADVDYTQGRSRLQEKISRIKTASPCHRFVLSDFGTRRRFSKVWHREVVETLVQEIPEHFVGSSNVLLAKALNIKPIGTMAHEYLQGCQALGPRLIYSQKFALEKWAEEYRGELGIALSDTIGMEPFFRDFDLYFCKLFDGVRQDSGDPYQWGERLIAHYEAKNIDPTTKTIVFSDCLTFDKAIKIYQTFKDRINVGFGIGTHLTNDLGFDAIQCVIKMVYCNEQPVAKLSDTPEKTMCPDASYLQYLKQVFQI
ncbi:MAG: nicotinate phosphoribosyltransferase [Legionellales bacterium]|nr:nicotinate phosphoribosyltransferase [Legionellales bacterium]